MKHDAVEIHGSGVILPGVSDPGHLGTWFAAHPAIRRQVDAVPPPHGMQERDMRRMAHLTRLALYAADRACESAGVRGRDAGIYIGMTHGTTSYLKEFHDYLLDYGPEMASPNTFSNGVNGAALGTVSRHLGLTDGGSTLLGYETGGLDVLDHAAGCVAAGIHELCYAGAVEEYSPLVERAYADCGLHRGAPPACLPSPSAGGGFPVSEGCVFFIIGPRRTAGEGAQVLYRPVENAAGIDTQVDCVVSCAGGGPPDVHELALLRQLAGRNDRPVPIVFPKPLSGELFAVSPLLAVLTAVEMLHGRLNCPAAFALHRDLQAVAGPAPGAMPSTVAVTAASRDGETRIGLLTAVRPA